MKPFAFRGGVALITGAASGIGRALALELAARSCHLALVDRNKAALKETAVAARERGAQVSIHVTDLSQLQSIEPLVADVMGEHGRLTLLINNAGVALEGTFEEVTLEEFEWLMTINFRAVVTLTKVCLPHLLDIEETHIVNMSSIFGVIAPPGSAGYSASKFAVRGFTEALRYELAGRVGVTVIHPGGVKTNIALSSRIAAATDQAAAQLAVQKFAENVQTTPAEAAAVILRAIERRQGRALVGRDALMIEIVQRVFPSTYWRLLKGAFERTFGK